VIAPPPIPAAAPFSSNGDDIGELPASLVPQIKPAGRIWQDPAL